MTSGRTPKRGVSDDLNEQVKKIKVEHSTAKEDISKFVPKFDNPPTFIRASQILGNPNHTTTEIIPEISDEELLAMAIAFEKKHPEYN